MINMFSKEFQKMSEMYINEYNINFESKFKN